MALQFRRGTAAERIAAGDIPEPGEPWFTSDDSKLYIGDGSTPGGVAVSANALEDLGNVTLISEATNTLTDYEITSNVATVSTTTNNGYYEGLEVTISSSTATILNGTHTITSIVSGSSFTFALTNADVLNTSTDGAITPKIPDGNVLTWNESEGSWEDSAPATYLANIAEDTTPQLGGNLDVNGQDIVSDSNGDINLAPNGTGKVVIKGNVTGGSGNITLNCEENTHGVTIQAPPHSAAATYSLTLPTTDGDPNQVLTTDGSGELSWTTPVAAIEDLSNVDVTSPSNGQTLIYNSTSTNWEPGTISGGGTALQHTSFSFNYGGTPPAAVVANSSLIGQNYGTWSEINSANANGPSSPVYDPTLTGIVFDAATGKFSGFTQGRYQITGALQFVIDNPTPASGTSVISALILSDPSFTYFYGTELAPTPVLSYASYNSTASTHYRALAMIGIAEDSTPSNNQLGFYADQDMSPSYYIEYATLNIVRIGDI